MMAGGGYPRADEFDELLYQRILEMTLPNGQIMEINWFRVHVWSEATKFIVPREKLIRGMQANMFSIQLEGLDDQGQSQRRHLIAKRIVPGELPPKSNMVMWKQFVESVQREIDFYKELLGLENADEIRALFPRIYYSDGSKIQCEDDILGSSYFFILMDDVSESFYQSCQIDETQAKSVLRNLAKFHAFFWNRLPSYEPRGSFWTLERRKPLQELEDAVITWSALLKRLPSLAASVPNADTLVTDVVTHAEKLDTFVGKTALTRIHGDCKGFNLFLSQTNDGNVLFIDMQWTGSGNPLQDVAYVLTTTLQADVLPNMDKLVDFYCHCLSEFLPKTIWDEISEEFRIGYDLIWLDYARVIMTGLWKKLSEEYMERCLNTIGPSMINRSKDHALFIVRRVHSLVREQNVLQVLMDK
ncbi:uncharacterized protein LOC131876920 [Tigriopus californicus]|uniref:uncharacterized protein LOC131876920 n=1 Tax=Tigriopus californicus TaxID=6832 RepID=UPI0027DA0C9E|nr:uncharacterized protein LOC131876920 [Tigriopus californicus]